MQTIISKIKEWVQSPAGQKVVYEIKSSLYTFSGILAGYLIGSPVINHLFQLDLPTIQQLSDVWPVVLDAVYRALWMTILTKLGFAQYRQQNVQPNR